MSRGQLLATTTSYELSEWQVYESIEPFSQARFEVYMATVLALITNIYKDPAKPKAKVTDFLFFHEKPATTQADLISALTGLLGGNN